MIFFTFFIINIIYITKSLNLKKKFCFVLFLCFWCCWSATVVVGRQFSRSQCKCKSEHLTESSNALKNIELHTNFLACCLVWSFFSLLLKKKVNARLDVITFKHFCQESIHQWSLHPERTKKIMIEQRKVKTFCLSWTSWCCSLIFSFIHLLRQFFVCSKFWFSFLFGFK